MNPVVTRLGAFALVLAGTFGTAYAVGEKLPGHGHTASEDEHGLVDDMDHGTASDDGTDTEPAAHGYQLVTDLNVGPGVVGFHLIDPARNRVTDLTEMHGALLHTVLIRPDLGGFQHIHPAIADDGSWVVPITESGPWHIVFDTVPAGSSTGIVVTADIDDGADFAATPVPAAATTVNVDGVSITLESTADGMSFTVTPSDGLEPYLGQSAHLFAFRAGDLAFQHLHPGDAMPGTFTFYGSLDGPGTYRLFLQFGYDGSVVTVPFTVVQS